MKSGKKGFSRVESISVPEFVSSDLCISWQWKRYVLEDTLQEQGDVTLLTWNSDTDTVPIT